nr:HAD hydrolase family protein [Flavobacterium covae]
MPEESLTEIDSLTDWEIVEMLLAKRQKQLKEQKRIDYLVLDVDGVFTDGCVYYSKEGELMKKFDMRDGMGLEILRQNNVEVVVITSENSKLVEERMKKLQIKNLFLGVKDKFSLLKDFVLNKNTSFGNIAYVGDDVNDLTCICSVGWSFTPQNATVTLKNNADIILNKNSSGRSYKRNL